MNKAKLIKETKEQLERKRKSSLILSIFFLILTIIFLIFIKQPVVRLVLTIASAVFFMWFLIVMIVSIRQYDFIVKSAAPLE